MMHVELDGMSLTTSQVVAIARSTDVTVGLSSAARSRLDEMRAYIEQNWLNESAPPMYGFNTGLGKLKDTRIPMTHILDFQRSTINAHSAGVGQHVPEEVVRATLLLRANALARGVSGPRSQVVVRIIELLNAGVHPVIPQQGSVGASGDLAPLAYLAGALVGHERAEAFYRGVRMPARDAIAAAGIAPTEFHLEAKDGLALINGSTLSLAYAVLALDDARRLVTNADVALAMSLEAIRGELAAFDERVQAARPHQGQAETAANVRQLTRDSGRCTPEAREVVLPDEGRVPAQTIPARVQDAYSLRCAPQVHGPVRDALRYIESIVSVEINSATDNPLMFESGSSFEVLSAGNFHGQYLAQACDLLAMVLTDLGSISERRTYRLLDPTMSYGLPSNLVAVMPGVNTGYSIAHCSMAALVTENKTLCWPASVDSVPTKSNQEDHVSNSTWSSRKARSVLANVQQIVATEMLIAAQAISVTEPYLGDFKLGSGTDAALRAVRERIPAALDGDRWLHADLADALSLVQNDVVATAVQQACGSLV